MDSAVQKLSAETRNSNSFAWIICGVVFGAIGPLLRLLPISRISRYDPKEPGPAIFWAELDIYLWPTHLLAWSEGIWKFLAIVGNFFFFLAGAYLIYLTKTSLSSRVALLMVMLVWVVAIGWFLAGFEIARMNITTFVAGLAFYVAFVIVTDLTVAGFRSGSR
jgi:drug/metabolite transporter (DMT)-like permease